MSDLVVTNPLTVLKYISLDNHYVGRWGFSSRPGERPGMLEAARGIRLMADLCLDIDRLRALRSLPTFDLYVKCQAEYFNADVGKVGITHLEPDRTITSPPGGALLSRPLQSAAVDNFEEELQSAYPGVPLDDIERLGDRIRSVVDELDGVTDACRPIAQELRRFLREEVEPLLAESVKHGMWFLTSSLVERVQDRILATGIALQLSGEADTALLLLNLLVTFLGVAVPALSVPMAVGAALIAIGDGSNLFARIGEAFTRPALPSASRPELEAGS